MDIYEEKWTAAKRKAYHDEHPDNFAGPDLSFPIQDANDVKDAWNLAGHADNPEAVRSKVKAIAKRLGLAHALPDTAKDEESVQILSALHEASIPKQRIATIRVCFIEDNARSLNGRLYPREAVDTLIASGQRKLLDSESLPLTCFLSHKAADEDETKELIGKITRIWREGSKGMALIDLADTTVARDALALIAGGYLCTESLRAKNAELKTDPRYDVPIVSGSQLELEGIDLTNYPGLEHVARIQHVQISESAQSSSFLDAFSLVPSALTIGEPMLEKEKLQEEAIASTLTGNSQGMTSDTSRDAYAQRLMPTPTLTDPLQPSTPHPLMEAHMRAHAHLSRVLDTVVHPVHENMTPPEKGDAQVTSPIKGVSAVKGLESLLATESGRKLAKHHAKALVAAHDEAARACEMACEGAYHKHMNKDPDNDGDDDSNPAKNPDRGIDNLAHQKESKMSAEEALRILEASGYDVQIQKKKSETELLKEQLDTLKAEHARQFEEMKNLLQTTQPTRKSKVLGATSEETPKKMHYLPLHGKHLQEQINRLEWEKLADRTAPLPESIPLELLIKEFEQYYAVMYDGRYGILSAEL